MPETPPRQCAAWPSTGSVVPETASRVVSPVPSSKEKRTTGFGRESGKRTKRRGYHRSWFLVGESHHVEHQLRVRGFGGLLLDAGVGQLVAEDAPRRGFPPVLVARLTGEDRADDGSVGRDHEVLVDHPGLVGQVFRPDVLRHVRHVAPVDDDPLGRRLDDADSRVAVDLVRPLGRAVAGAGDDLLEAELLLARVPVGQIAAASPEDQFLRTISEADRHVGILIGAALPVPRFIHVLSRVIRAKLEIERECPCPPKDSPRARVAAGTRSPRQQPNSLQRTRYSIRLRWRVIA